MALPCARQGRRHLESNDPEESERTQRLNDAVALYHLENRTQNRDPSHADEAAPVDSSNAFGPPAGHRAMMTGPPRTAALARR
jgi:hypothetical protein